jgi:hypothetical protein
MPANEQNGMLKANKAIKVENFNHGPEVCSNTGEGCARCQKD